MIKQGNEKNLMMDGISMQFHNLTWESFTVNSSQQGTN